MNKLKLLLTITLVFPSLLSGQILKDTINIENISVHDPDILPGN